MEGDRLDAGESDGSAEGTFYICDAAFGLPRALKSLW
jgi:hypothetical protein